MRRPLLVSTALLAALTLGGCGNGTVIGSSPPATPTPFPTEVSNEFVLPSTGNQPTGIVLGPDGLIYVADRAASTLVKFDPTATPVAFTQYLIPTPNAQPFDLITWSGSVWMTEFGASAVGVLGTSPVKITNTALPTANAGPTYAAIGPDGNLWVSETTANKIARVQLVAGVPSITEFPVPTPNAGLGGLSYSPQFKDNNIWIVESNASQIVPFNTSTLQFGTPVPTLTANAGPTQMIAGPDGALWFTESNAVKMGRLATTTGVITEYPLTPAKSVSGIVVGLDQNLWFTDPTSNSFAKFVLSANPPSVAEYPIPSSNALSPAALLTPTFMALGADSLIYFPETNTSKIAQTTY